MTNDGSLYSWGDNNNGRLGVGAQGGSYYGQPDFSGVSSTGVTNVKVQWGYETGFVLYDNYTMTPTPTPVATTTTMAPTLAPTTTTMVPTVSTTRAPTTTVVPTTTTSTPTTMLSTTSSPTTTDMPTPLSTTTYEPTTSTHDPTTTTAPTSAVTTTTESPSTTAVPTTTTTLVPTSPATTSQSTRIINNATLTSVVIGDASQVPTATTNSGLVLFSNDQVKTLLAVNFQDNADIPKTSALYEASITFNVAYVALQCVVVITLTDQYGNAAGSAKRTISSTGSYSVDMKDILVELIATYNQGFSIKIIRGNVLKVSLGIETDNVPIEIEPKVVSTIQYASASDAPVSTVGATTLQVSTTVPSTTAAAQLGEAMILPLVGIVFGSVAATVLLVTIPVVAIIAIIACVILAKRRNNALTKPEESVSKC